MPTLTHRFENWLFPRLPLISRYYASFVRARAQLKAVLAANEQQEMNQEAAFFLVNTLQDNCRALEWELKRVKAERDAALFVANVTEAERNTMESYLRHMCRESIEAERIKSGKATEHRWIRIDMMPPNAAEITKQEMDAIRSNVEREMSELPGRIAEMEALSKHWSDEANEARMKLAAYEAAKENSRKAAK